MPCNQHETFELKIDNQYIIKFVNDEWLKFASNCGANLLTRENVLGHSLFEFVSGTEVQMFYKYIIEKVRSQNESFHLPFRCDAPDLRRFLEMEIHLDSNDYIIFSSRIIKLESRIPIRLLDYSVPRNDEIISICSICKQVKLTDDRWVEVEEAIKIKNLFGESVMPMISHGLCPSCAKTFLGEQLKSMKAMRSG